MIHYIINLPSWTLIRIFGILSYFSLFVGMALGIIYSFPQWKGHRKGQLLRWHTFVNQLGVCLALLHSVFLVIDTYMPFEWHEILIPFTAKQSSNLNAIGTLAMYGLLILLFTTDIRHKLKRKLWYTLHLLSYPIFVLSLIHGLFLGSDSRLAWIKLMYFSTAALLVALTSVRFFIQPSKRQVRVQPSNHL